MGFNFRLHQPLGVIDSDGNSLQTTIELSWRGNPSESIRLDSLELSIWVSELRLWPKIYIPLGGLDLTGSSSTHPVVPLPWTPGLISKIESARAASGGTLAIKAEGYVRYHELVEISLPEQPNKYVNRSQRFPGTQHTEHFQVSGHCHRDQWVGILKQIGWEDYAVFELPVRRISQHPDLAAGFKRLQQAHAAFRNENWPGTVTECRAAMESAVSVVVEAKTGQDAEKNRKAAYETFVRHVFPHENDGAKRETLSDLIQALSHLRHTGGAHGWDFRAQVLREDAELALTVATAIFRYVGEAISTRPLAD